jgi:hypothetical protein
MRQLKIPVIRLCKVVCPGICSYRIETTFLLSRFLLEMKFYLARHELGKTRM